MGPVHPKHIEDILFSEVSSSIRVLVYSFFGQAFLVFNEFPLKRVLWKKKKGDKLSQSKIPNRGMCVRGGGGGRASRL